jgi:glycine dehydrogenase subunit 1
VGADLVVGDLQSLGLSLSFGGPYAGFIACLEKYVRQLPGRLVGRTTDAEGKTGYVLTLQTREQHIRRAKATSNICTNQALCALASTIYLALMGPIGLRQAAELSLRNAHELQTRLCALDGVRLAFDQPFFNEFVLELPVAVSEFIARARSQGLLPGIPLSPQIGLEREALLVCATEKTTAAEMDLYVEILHQTLSEAPALSATC